VTNNTLRLLTINRKCDIPVVKGSSKPLIKESEVNAEKYHGELGK
jgi:inosine-uridine nucleoside N-ribohydrolase